MREPLPNVERRVTRWWLRLEPSIARRSLRASLVVGTVLTLLNHGDRIAAGEPSPALWWKVPLTYLVPFLVATYGANGVGNRRQPPD